MRQRKSADAIVGMNRAEPVGCANSIRALIFGDAVAGAHYQAEQMATLDSERSTS
jgi:hypothetical protein